MSKIISDNPSGIVVSMGQIQYTLVTTQINYSFNEFYKIAFSLLRTLPIELLQLRDSLDFFSLSYALCLRKGINLFTLPDIFFSGSPESNLKAFQEYSASFNNDLVKVFIIDKDIKNHQQLAKMIDEITFSYFTIIGDIDAKRMALYNEQKCFYEAKDLIKLIEKDLPKIASIIKNKYDIDINEFNLSKHPKANILNPDYPSMYNLTNYYILNQILGNYWAKEVEDKEKKNIPMFSKDRAAIQIKQADVIDRMSFALRQEKKTVTPIEPVLPSIIIISQFHFPKYGKLLKEKPITKKQKMTLRVLQTEQMLDYTYGFDEDLTDYFGVEGIAKLMKILVENHLMLDCAAYLHAQLANSPVFRMPIVGKSLNTDLSHFEQDFSNKANAIKKIGKIGALMREKLVADELADYLMIRDGQIVFISDLPMEWLKIGKYPICLTHDVCRIPEFNFNSLVNTYIHNQRLNFSIKPDILKRTLLIHCASEDDLDMHSIFELFKDSKDKLGFKSEVCKNVEDISLAIKKHKPDLLIFDCHGDFDQRDLSSFLVIDGKNNILLTGDDIIANNISAPLVFISACSTMPNYGYVKFLSDAFFQAGAFAVTATFLPIKMVDAAVLLIRILRNLKQQEGKIIFSNWLAFISNTLRGVMVHEMVKKARYGKKLQKEIDNNKIAEILTELMVFSLREKAFENLKEYLHEIDPTINTGFESLEHEWLSYTTIGRADLIYFESWISKHRELNLET